MANDVSMVEHSIADYEIGGSKRADAMYWEKEGEKNLKNQNSYVCLNNKKLT